MNEFDITINIKYLETGKLKVELTDRRPSYFDDWDRSLTIKQFICDIESYLSNNRHIEFPKIGRPQKADVDRIYALREQGKTQEQIANELNISVSTVRRSLSKKQNRYSII